VDAAKYVYVYVCMPETACMSLQTMPNSLLSLLPPLLLLPHCKLVFTPMATGTDLSATNPDDNETIHQIASVEGGPIVSYPSVVGSSMYVMLRT
jgi:hypothetical protein